MKKHLICLPLIAALCGCSPSQKGGPSEGQIDVLPALEQLTELKVSQLGKKVRYVPLETTEESLVDDSYNISLLEDKILVTTNGQYLLFDKQTGKYLCTVGQRGKGPRDYTLSDAPHYMKQEDGPLHLIQSPDKLLVYSQEGEYLDVKRIPLKFGNQHDICLTDEGGIIYDGMAFGANKDNRLLFFNTQGEKTDSITLYTPAGIKNIDMSNIARISVFKASKVSLSTLGMIAFNGLILIDLKDESRRIVPGYYPAFQKCDGKTLFHNAFSDTVFQVKDKTLVPHLIFNMGEKHFPIDMQGQKEGTEEFLTLTFVMETPQAVFFQMTEGIHQQGTEKLYDGIYDKQSGKVTVNKRAPLTDDLNGFMPFYLLTHNAKGEFGSMLEVPDILEWLEEHPETSLEGNLAPLKGLIEDDNPVCVIVEP